MKLFNFKVEKYLRLRSRHGGPSTFSRSDSSRSLNAPAFILTVINEQCGKKVVTVRDFCLSSMPTSTKMD